MNRIRLNDTTGCQMTDKDWEEVDLTSRQIFCKYLEQIGATEIKNSSGNCCYDISCQLKGKQIGFELKDRQIPSDKYGDQMIELYKEIGNDKRINRNEFEHCIVASFFTDNVIAMANIKDKDRTYKKEWCQNTTMIKGCSKKYVLKDTIHLPQRVKIKWSKVNNEYNFQRV